MRVSISGQPGADANSYQEREVQREIHESRQCKGSACYIKIVE